MKRKRPSLLDRIRQAPWHPEHPDAGPLLSEERFRYRRPLISKFVHDNERQLEEDQAFCSHFKSRRWRVPNAQRSPWWDNRTTDLHENIWTPSNDNRVQARPISGLDKSWFKARLTHKDPGERHAPLTSKYLSNAKYTLGNDQECVRTKKCQIFPTPAQKQKLELAIRAYKVTRSSCLRWIKKHKKVAHRLALWKGGRINPLYAKLKSQFVTNKRGGKDAVPNPYFEDKGWMLGVSKEFRDSAVDDVVANLKSCLSNVDRGHQEHFRQKLNSKARHCSFSVEKKVVCHKDRNQIELKYPHFFNKKGKKREKENSSSLFRCVKGDIPMDGVPDGECKVHRDSEGRYFVLLTYKIDREVEVCDTRPVIAGDMGVRKFITTYTTDGECHTLGQGCGPRLRKLLAKRSKIQSVLAKKALHPRERFRLRRSYRRAGRKVVGLRDELHRKLSNWLTTNYSVIILPRLRTKQLVNKESSVLGRQTKSVMMALGITLFYDRLSAKCEVRNVQLIDGDECYTTKGCDCCGLINHNVGSSERFRCSGCGRDADRDIHSARNIFLKNTRLYHI